ncbi:unnamed protein product [Ectocarpus fasciculatus]
MYPVRLIACVTPAPSPCTNVAVGMRGRGRRCDRGRPRRGSGSLFHAEGAVGGARRLALHAQDPDDAGVDTAAAIRRMKEARTRAVKGGGVKEVKTLKALQQELKAAKGMLVVVDFYADWCGPCKQIAPVYKEMAKEFPKAVLLKVNVDTNKETAQKYAVQSMPTFVMIKNGKKVDELKGAGEDALRQAISRNA